MTNERSIPSFRVTTILAVALSLGLGWGIRGNFGHELGAMVPGALAAVAACLLSGRADWRRRVAFFAFFGALGWGFGGSISYMKVIGYTHTGHTPTQAWGFAGLFVIGFLWAALGGAGTALPAVMRDRERLTAMFQPLLWILAAFLVFRLAGEALIERYFTGFNPTLHRQESPLYWFDADWAPAVIALLACFAYDLWDRAPERRRVVALFAGAGAALGWGVHGIATLLIFAARFVSLWIQGGKSSFFGGNGPITHALWLVSDTSVFVGALAGAGLGVLVFIACHGRRFGAYVAGGLLGGFLIQRFLTITGLIQPFVRLVCRPVGDTAFWDPEVLMINWPQFFRDIPEHVGWMAGLMAALCLYFAYHGHLRHGTSLYVHMAGGWLAAFILLPTLLDVHMTPPRSDDWAGILGLFCGAMYWFWRNNLKGVCYAAIVSGAVGGLGFSGVQCLKLALISFSDPVLTPTGALDPAWAHWHATNWHSWLEQSYGFVNGLGIAAAMGLLATRLPQTSDQPETRRWTEVVCVGFAIFVLTYLNLVKCVGTWVERGAVPATMKMPLVQSIEWSAETWFNIHYLAIVAAAFVLMARHLRHPLAFVPRTWLGKGQLLYLTLLWVMTIGNLYRAITRFTEGRILTEGAIILSAVAVTLLVTLCARGDDRVPYTPVRDWGPLVRRAAWAALAVALTAVYCELGAAKGLYGDKRASHAGYHLRFGPEAEWRTNPIRHDAEHR